MLLPYPFSARSRSSSHAAPSFSHASPRSRLRVRPRTSGALMRPPDRPHDFPHPVFCPLVPCGKTPPPPHFTVPLPPRWWKPIPVPSHVPTREYRGNAFPMILLSHARMVRKCMARDQPIAAPMRSFRNAQSRSSPRFTPSRPRGTTGLDHAVPTGSWFKTFLGGKPLEKIPR